MLGYTTPLLSSELSEDEDVPQSVEDTGIDTSAEDVRQHKRKKRRVQKTTSANSKEGDSQPCKRMPMTRSSLLAANTDCFHCVEY